MNDMTPVIVPKSDQISADDLIAGPLTIRIAEVDIRPGTEQPVTIHYDDDGGRPWKPCKSMCRVLVAAWGPDAKAYVGRAVTLYRDPKVKWGGMEVGGIRISHLSDIDREMVMALTATRGKRAPYTVKPLANAPVQRANDDPAAKWASAYIGKVNSFNSLDELEAFAADKAAKLDELKAKRPELHRDCADVLHARRLDLAVEGPADEQRGEAFADEDEF
ncbi:hypothetical protein [Rhizorhapis suberifaciens]|uniref:Uncharacterized protein n=1 Tax=Rhizorhapis suberifaciens TaxID=13656 RepID=A0A840HXF7_9SPHN|nr:hypothetical protein [Rhizorhapis suberifaciens]MBB4642331.1 hypothetical protein [Rhizorhapis suberifaciens]